MGLRTFKIIYILLTKEEKQFLSEVKIGSPFCVLNRERFLLGPSLRRGCVCVCI